MKYFLNISASAAAITMLLAAAPATAQNKFNGYKGYYGNIGCKCTRTSNTRHTRARTAVAHTTTAVPKYEYIEGPRYRSPYAGNNAGEWSYGKDADSPCYHGNYGYNGQTSNYDPSKCVVVYDAKTYVRLLRGSSSMGGTQFFGTSGFYGAQRTGLGYPNPAQYTDQSYANRNAGNRFATTASPAGAYQAQQGQRLSASENNATTGHSQDASGTSGHEGGGD